MNPKRICTHLEILPDIHPSAFVAPGAVVVGNVEIGEHASIWYQCVLRADIERILIGPGSNIQDGTIVHLASDLGTTVGSFVTVGHRALLHACWIDDEVLISMGAIVMDGARIGARSIVGAGSLIPKGMEVPPGSLVMGVPGRIVRSLSREEQTAIRGWADKYIQVATEHRARLKAS